MVSGTSDRTQISQRIAQQLPYLRRYARALTGSQSSGDAFASATLEAILSDPSMYDPSLPPKVSLFRVFHGIWTSVGSPTETSDISTERAANRHLLRLTPNTREALLLRTLERCSMDEIALILDASEEETLGLLEVAQTEMAESVRGNILIIEDESLIAWDIHEIVTEMGHSATGIARTMDGAVQLGLEKQPDLILADVHLADGSSGIEAVNELLETIGDVPVIFITAYPERLLTGDRPEPAFIIAKPYEKDQVSSAISQAMFFSSTETLHG